MTDFHTYGIDDAVTDVYKKLTAADTEGLLGEIDKYNRELTDEDPEVFTIVNSLGTNRGQVVDNWHVNVNVHLKLLSGAKTPSSKLGPIKQIIDPVFNDTGDGVTSYEILWDTLIAGDQDKTGYIIYNFRLKIYKT
jgi:hypothetical protein